MEGDAQLPPIDWAEWREVSRERHAAADGNPYDYSFVVYERADCGKSGLKNAVLPPD
jgi:dihydrofolate reductase